MIERQHLAILRETDRLGSVTAAADVLHLTQSALSHAIRRLEAQAGVALWEKEGRRLRPTQAGRHLIALAARVLPQLEQAEATLADFARGRKGLLRIGMECHPCYRWLLRVVEPYLRDWPQVDVDVRQAFQFGGVGALLGHVLAHVINQVSFGWTLVTVEVPWSAFGEAMLLAVVAAVLAGLQPAWRFSRMRPAEALREA